MDFIEGKIDASIRSMSTQEDFAAFMELLVQDYEENLEIWMNQDLASFLQAMAKYAAGEGGFSEGIDLRTDQPGWAHFADILACSRAWAEQ